MTDRKTPQQCDKPREIDEARLDEVAGGQTNAFTQSEALSSSVKKKDADTVAAQQQKIG